MKKILLFLSVCAAAISAVSCTTTNVKIRTVPKEGYDTYYNEKYIGKTPCDIEASNLVWRSHNIKLKNNNNKLVYEGELEEEFKLSNLCLWSWIYGIGLLYCRGPMENQIIAIKDGQYGPGSGSAVGGHGQYRLAVMDFQAKGVNNALAANVTELIRAELIKTGSFLIIERSQMDQRLREQCFQQTGCSDVTCAVQVGKMLSANKILIGSVMKMGKNIVISGRIVDVEKGVGEKAATHSVESVDDLVRGASGFSGKISGTE